MSVKPGLQTLTGNEAAATALELAELDCFAGYPITPSTETTEKIADQAVRKIPRIDAVYKNADSEISSFSMLQGVSAAGGRCATASSSQGILFAFEALHWASTSLLPFVFANTNRSVGSPWSIHPDHTDSMCFRDCFIPQLYCETAQEVLDLVLWG